jgi:hypothetical protein
MFDVRQSNDINKNIADYSTKHPWLLPKGVDNFYPSSNKPGVNSNKIFRLC